MSYSRQVSASIGTALGFALVLTVSGCGNSQLPAASQQTGGGKEHARDHLEQAAGSVVAAAKESVAAASSDDQAVNRTHMAVEALRYIGMMGDFDTNAQTDSLLDEIQSSARPAVAEAITQMRLARHLRQWTQLSASERNRAIDGFVADVKKRGLTPASAQFAMRVSDMLENANDNKLAAKAIGELLPAFRAAKDPGVQRMAEMLEGSMRRQPGKKLELEGTLLDGTSLDWDSYRGKVVLVDYFASWCGPCRAEVPNVLENYRAYRDKGFEVVGVNMNKHNERQDVEAYFQETGFQFPTLFSTDPGASGWDHPMGRKYGVTALPRAILVDKNGVIVSSEARGEELGALLQELLGSPGASIGSTGSSDAFPAAPSGELHSDPAVVPAAALEEQGVQSAPADPALAAPAAPPES